MSSSAEREEGMAGGDLQSLVGHLRRAAAPSDCPGPSDSDLLARFAASGDEAAFELLLWRHGGMVLGLCRRLLRHLGRFRTLLP